MSRETRVGLLYTTGAFLLWGAVPVYWKMLSDVPALEILAHRIVWALVLVVLWMTIRRRWHDLATVLHRPRTVAALLDGLHRR